MSDDPVLNERFGKYTPEGKLTPGYGDGYLFYAGRDDIHGIMLDLLQAEKLSCKINMYGFDDQELNDAILAYFKNPSIHVQISLDKAQAGGVHEKQILEADQQQDPADFANSFTILQSATHQISHTKGGVLASQGIYFEGSTNWSSSGEGTGVSLKADVANPKGFKAQNNTLYVSTNKTNLTRFSVELDVEHLVGKNAQA
ncbi:MAG: hypothetical protein KGI25_03575 [Thaumarchaeota archaeon]|nr:hypothetical protein [Nitrososphaerota archaeon]